MLQWRYCIEVAHVAMSRHHGVRNRSEEVGGEMVRGVSGRGRTVVGLVFTEIGRREDKDLGFRSGISICIEIFVG